MKTIVVLGGGYAGLKTVVALQKKMRNEVKIILINQNSYHYETMRLYEVASGSYPYTRMSYELADVLDKSMSELIIDQVEKSYRIKESCTNSLRLLRCGFRLHIQRYGNRWR